MDDGALGTLFFPETEGDANVVADDDEGDEDDEDDDNEGLSLVSRVPHLAQNRLPTGMSCAHFEHRSLVGIELMRCASSTACWRAISCVLLS